MSDSIFPQVSITKPADRSPSAIKIGNHLITAYKGHYEDSHYEPEIAQAMKDLNDQEFATFFDNWIKLKIITDSPSKRLEIYLEWEGILGYSSTIYDIATGKL